MKRFLILFLCLIMGLGAFAQKELLRLSGNSTEVKVETSTVLSEGTWRYYDDGTCVDGIGGPTSFSWGIKLRAADIADLGALTKIAAFDRMSTIGTFDIFLGGNAAPETWVLNQSYTFTGAMDFVEIELTEAIDPAGQNVWIVFNTNDGVNYPAAECANTGDADGRWIYLDGNGWFDVASVPLDATWMIRGYFENGTAGYQETSVLYTTYDLQSNGHVANRMYQNADGDVAVVAMMSHQYNMSASDRGTGYSFSEGGDIDNFTYAEMREEANATGADMRTGWPSIAPYGANGEILVNHTNGLNYWIRETAGEGQWDGPYQIPNPTGLEYPFSMSWPRVTTSGPNNDIIHVVACAQYALADGSNINAQFYCRSTDGMNWDVDYSPLEETDEHINVYSADDYSIASNGDVVAICYNAVFHGDVVVLKSTDNGQTWERELVWENPYKGDWETDENTITPEEANPTPVHSTVAVGPDGTVHVAFSVASYYHSSLGTTFSYYHGRTCDGIAYWNDTRDPLTNIRLWQVADDGYLYHSMDSVNFCGWMPFYENIYDFDNAMLYSASDYVYAFYGSCSGYPALSIDPEGNIAMAYNTLDTRRDNGSYYYRSAFVSYKPAGQEEWNVAVQDLSEDFVHNADEVMWVSAASNTTRENEFWFSYLCDDTHGFYFGTNASQSYANDNNLYVTKFVANGGYDDDDEIVPYHFNFEDGTLAGWVTIDADGDGNTWVMSNEIFNETVKGHNGSKFFATSASYINDVGPLNPDNYLATAQKYAITAGSKISFWACALDECYPFEHFGVAVSTAGNKSGSDFTTISEWTIGSNRNVTEKASVRGTRDRLQTTWTKYEVDLSAYAGQDVYIAIRHFNCTDQSFLNIDDISIVANEGEPEEPEEPEDGPNRKVILEEFTGRNCGYCPDGHRIANEIAAANPGKVFPVNIHAGGFSPNSYPNLNTEDGEAIMNGFNVSGFPSGEVNRNTASAIGRGEWAGATNNQLAQVAEVSVNGDVTIDESTRTATITVELDYTSSSAYSTNYLTVMMLQDSIWGSQSGGSYNPEQYVNGQYCHMHVLRDVITSTWGDAISNTTAGSHVTKTYTYYIPEVIGDPNGVEVVLDHIYFLAMVTETNTGVASRPVLNVNKLDIAGDDDDDVPYYYSFENGMEGWTTINANGDDHTWYHSSECETGHGVKPATSHTGAGHICSESYCNATWTSITPDDYIVSPVKYAITAGSKISFWAAAQDENYQAEHFGVAISTGSNTSAADFTTISEWTIGAKVDAKGAARGYRGQTTWTRYEADLSAYAGQEVYIAIRHFDCSDQFILLVDDIEITSEECLVDFIMYDSYGDGWNGSTLTVAFDNAPSQILEFTEGSNITHTLAIATGTYVSVSFNTNGNNWPDECSYSIEYHNGGEIYNSNGQPSEGYNVGFVVNCGEEPEDPQEPEDGPNRKVIIEEFTGRNCTYCPDGHRVANEIAAANPGKVYPIVIHAISSFSPTSYPNLNTEDGAAIMNGFNVNFFPSGEVNRNTASAIDRGQWAAETYDQLAQVAEVSVNGDVTIDASTRTATITVELDYTSSSAYSTNYLTVMMLQDSIWGSQSGGSSNPEQYVNGQYCHMHVLRDVITPTWGDAINNTTAGSHVTKTYTYYIPEVIGDPNGVEVDLDNIYFLAIVTETNQGVATRPVLNVNKLSMAGVDDEEIVNHWNPDASLYPNTMTMVGVVEIDGVEQTDTKLEVGAFCGDEVRGSARLEYQSNVGRYMMFMTLYGNTGDNISFKLYDHNVDTESDYVCGETVNFVVDDILGGLVNPYVISFVSDITQSHNLNAGWNWYSTYIEVEGSEGLEMMQEGLGDDAIQIKSHNSGFVNYEAGIWFGGLTEIKNEEMYMIKMSSSHVLEMTGAYGDPSAHPITLGTNWKWIGYPVNATMSVNEAFSNITPNNGDYVKSQFHFAQYYEGLGWTGTLGVMEPGNGYMYQNTSGYNKTLVYPTPSSKEVGVSNVSPEPIRWSVDAGIYGYNMTMVAKVERSGEELKDYEVGVFSGSEVRGSARPIYVESLDSYMMFMMIYGEETEELTMKLYDTERGEEIEIGSVIFEKNSSIGDVKDPYVIMMSPTSIGECTIETLSIYPNPVGEREEIRLGGEYDVVEVYNSIGVKVAEYKNVSKIDGLEASGVYVVRIVEGDKVAYDRIVVE